MMLTSAPAIVAQQPARPFTMAFALVRNTTPGFEAWEQACHEGNRRVEGMLEVGLKPFPGVRPPKP